MCIRDRFFLTHLTLMPREDYLITQFNYNKFKSTETAPLNAGTSTGRLKPYPTQDYWLAPPNKRLHLRARERQSYHSHVRAGDSLNSQKKQTKERQGSSRSKGGGGEESPQPHLWSWKRKKNVKTWQNEGNLKGSRMLCQGESLLQLWRSQRFDLEGETHVREKTASLLEPQRTQAQSRPRSSLRQTFLGDHACSTLRVSQLRLDTQTAIEDSSFGH
eukprot:TRINITY_DN6033_c0_g3_i1.p1 TRINITY_DN6033_c0_g3~~TRINITY_DN6033_c0_g3_i1.p1  ORF type:complete len:217 (-),score=5.94 TRINITY_DN6033_c0_g3_i1:374-1024(-)